MKLITHKGITLYGKYIRPTWTDCGHTIIYHNEREVGYIIPNRSKYRTVGRNWDFVPAEEKWPTLSASNRGELLRLIAELISP